MQPGSTVRRVIESQGEVWAKALRVPTPDWNLTGRVLCVGSGTSYYLALAVAELGMRWGIDITARPTQDVILDGEHLLRQYNSLVVISRSGETSEAIWSAKMSRSAGLRVLGVTCNESASLTEQVDNLWAFPDAHDHTVVMIRSFTTMLLAFQRVLAHLGGVSGVERQLENLVSLAPGYIEQASRAVAEVMAKPPRRVYILGAGIRHGIALEGSLKCLEMSNESAAAYGPLEFRHGPWGSVTPDDLVVTLGQSAYGSHERQVVRDLAERTPQLLSIASGRWFERQGLFPGTSLMLPDGEDWATGPLAVVPLQWLGWYWALSRGQNPDSPRNLTEVVDLHYGS